MRSHPRPFKYTVSNMSVPNVSHGIIVIYYAATAVFLSLDFFLGINVRVAFLETMPGFRLAYYAVCFGCLVLMLWRPAWTTVVALVESLATMIALIFTMALRSMIVTDAMLETGVGFVTMSEIVNFVIAGGAAYLSWLQGLKALANRSIGY